MSESLRPKKKEKKKKSGEENKGNKRDGAEGNAKITMISGAGDMP